MKETARKTEPVGIFLSYAAVLEKTGAEIALDLAGRRLSGRRSVSCLVDPEPGDLCLVSEDSFGRCFVLSVLTREGEGDVSLAFARDVEIKLPGRLRATAGEGVALASEEVKLISGRLELSALVASVGVEKLTFIGRLLDGQVERIKLIGEACDSIFERVSQRVKDSFRKVSGTDSLETGHLNYAVKKLLAMRGKYAVVTAEKDVRIDGEKILMG